MNPWGHPMCVRGPSKRREAGFGLLLTLFAMGVTVLTLGASIDFSHIFLVRDELQSAADEIARAAAVELDGSRAGVERARRLARGEADSSPRRDWLTFSTDRPVAFEISFSESPEGEWRSSPQSSAGLRFVSVRATAAAKLFFLPMLPTAPAAQPVTVHSIAGQVPVSPAVKVEAMVSAAAPDPAAAGYGFVAGQRYRLSARDGVPCARMLAGRLRHDTDPVASTYEGYRRDGNGQRLLIARVNGVSPAAFAVFLIPRRAAETGVCEADYAGASPLAGTRHNAAGPPGLYEVRLYQ